MYTANAFKQTDIDKLHAIITDNPFATLITKSIDGEIEANHIPFIFDKTKNCLQGHIAKANPLWKTTQANSQALVIFHGADHYITPNWYPSKKRDGKAVPTWNYIVVHTRGELSFINDSEWKMAMLETLTNAHEKSLSEQWQVSDAPADYIDKMLNAIVGIEINIDSLTGKWKISQNQSEENQQGVITGLTKINTTRSNAMEKIIKTNIKIDNN